MTLLFEITSEKNYSIATFFVEKDYAGSWRDIIDMVPFPLKLQNNISHIKMEKHSDNKNYIFTVINDYEGCLCYLNIYIKQHKKPYLNFKRLEQDEEKISEYEEFGYATEKEYEEFCHIDRCLNELFRSDNCGGYNYEGYIPEYD